MNIIKHIKNNTAFIMIAFASITLFVFNNIGNNTSPIWQEVLFLANNYFMLMILVVCIYEMLKYTTEIIMTNYLASNSNLITLPLFIGVLKLANFIFMIYISVNISIDLYSYI